MSSILLKRLKIINGIFVAKLFMLLGAAIMIAGIVIAMFKSCGESDGTVLSTPIYWECDTVHIDGNIVGYGFRPRNTWNFRTQKHTTYIYDTIKPKPINHRLILSGSDTTFRFLVFAIQNPLDVTPNQKTQLLQWINNSLKQDTTKQK